MTLTTTSSTLPALGDLALRRSFKVLRYAGKGIDIALRPSLSRFENDGVALATDKYGVALPTVLAAA
jgi:hypothetical protein